MQYSTRPSKTSAWEIVICHSLRDSSIAFECFNLIDDRFRGFARTALHSTDAELPLIPDILIILFSSALEGQSAWFASAERALRAGNAVVLVIVESLQLPKQLQPYDTDFVRVNISDACKGGGLVDAAAAYHVMAAALPFLPTNGATEMAWREITQIRDKAELRSSEECGLESVCTGGDGGARSRSTVPSPRSRERMGDQGSGKSGRNPIRRAPAFDLFVSMWSCSHPRAWTGSAFNPLLQSPTPRVPWFLRNPVSVALSVLIFVLVCYAGSAAAWVGIQSLILKENETQRH
jgi:hypothetical protein